MAEKKVLTEEEAHEMREVMKPIFHAQVIQGSELLKIVRHYAGIYGLLLGFSPTNFLSLAFLRMNIIFLCLPIRNRKRCLGWVISHESQTTCFKAKGVEK